MTDSFVISRVFAASRERMWDAWTVPEQFAAWFGPKGVTTEVLHFDLRPGGFLHSKVTGPDGAVSWAKSTYDAIDPQSRIGNIQPDADHQHAAGVIVGDDGGVEGFDRQIAFRLGDLVFRLLGVGGVLGVVGGPCGRRRQQQGGQAKAGAAQENHLPS